jgi:hypothetical protein
MYTDVVQLKLEKSPTESEEGIPLAALGKYRNKRFYLSFIAYLKDVEHVLISINIKIICFLLELKKEKFINVPNLIIINFWILTMLIVWLFMPYVGIHFIRKSSSVVQLIGQLKFGTLIFSKTPQIFSSFI